MIDAIPLLLGPEGYQISRSVRLRSSASAYFNRTPSSGGNRQKFTLSVWVKRGSLGGTQNLINVHSSTSGADGIRIDADKLNFYCTDATNANLATTAVFRDPSAWYHIVFAIDTTQATSTNRVRVYVNSIEQTSFSTSTYPTQNFNTSFNEVSRATSVGRNQPYANEYFDGYMAEFNWIDGQQLTPSSFGETNPVTGVWQPKKYTGTYGTNGFYLNFSDNSAATAAAIGKDYSGNGNNWTPNNISVTAGATYDSMLDVPTQWADGGNGRGNYAVMNPLDVISGSNAPTYSNANLTLAVGNANYKSRGSIGASSGKYYFEFGGTNVGGIYNTIVVTGIINESGTDWRYVVYDGTKTSGGVSGGAYGTAYGSGAWPTIGCAIDLDSGKIWFRSDAGWFASGDPAAGTNAAYTNVSGTVRPYFEGGGGGYSGTIQFNFGQRPFAYTPPTGFKALNTLNLPTPTILKGNQYMDVSLWTGNGTSQTIVNSGGFAPDLVWFKSRSSGALWNVLCDTVRGATKELYSNSTSAETTDVTDLTAFNSNGFSVGSGNGANQNAGTYVGWQWKEGATQGFDIVTYTGTGATLNVSHNLGVVPSMIITKSRSATGGWPVYHVSIGATGAVQLESTGATSTTSAYWNNTAPTSTQFTLASGLSANGTTYVAYLFAAVAGYSAFGSYTGNGSADGPMIFTGFRPAFVLIKASAGTTQSWQIQDSTREPYNDGNRTVLFPDLSNAEITDAFPLDFLSNGFKIRNSGDGNNRSSATYIYAAFSEFPFKNSLAR